MGPETSTPSTSAIAAAPSAQKTSTTALAPGFRFHPTDEELIIYYLKRKMCGKSFRFDVIADVDIYKTEPWDLAGKSKLKTRDQEWYFFSALDKKYANGGRMNRATISGYWKATGNDRGVQHDSRVVGLKKTLVFHSGRAPEGKRTNWVMHEYRLVEDELKKFGNFKDAYVLCRIFHKANLGPPTGHRYAPFVEEEWDGEANVVPSVDTKEEAVPQGNGIVQEMPPRMPPVCRNELPTKTQCLLAVCKSETMGETLDDPSAICPTNRETAPLLHYKRRRDIDLNSIDSTGSENSPKKSEGPSSSAITTAGSPMNLTGGLSTLVEYSLMESLDIKEGPRIPLSTFAPANFNATVPPECLDFIHSLQEEIYKVSFERETVRLEMLSIRSMANVLQSKVDNLTKENEELKSEGPSSSTITTARSAMNLTGGLSTLVEYSLMESLDIKEGPRISLETFAPANLNATVPPECLDFIHSLQKEIYKVSIESKTLRLEMLSIRSMANVLQSKVNHLTKENEELKRKVQDA